MMPKRFDHFMEEALYGPKGYYSGQGKIFGTGGDFSTSPTLSASFGRAVAGWITKAWDRTGSRLPVIELGAGDGSLARAVRDAIPFWQRPFLTYDVVEKSKTLQARQETALKKKGNRQRWHNSLAEALNFHGGEALIISNEVIDAFPARIFRKTGEAWEELWLKNGHELWQPADQLPKSTQWDHNWPEGQRIEIHEAAHQFLNQELSAMKQGEILTIDYGGSAGKIYHRRPRGTLRAYFLHNLVEPPQAYQNPGKQDLTCDVCFDDLIAWGKQIGLETVTLQSQKDFLKPFARETLADIYLSHQDGPGEAFQVLCQRK